MELLDEVLISSISSQAANYILLPGQDHEGTWHVEGMVSYQIHLVSLYSTVPLAS